MSALSAIRIAYEALRSRAFGTISGTYAAVGSSLVNPCRILKLNNTTDADLIVSFNGITDHDVIPAGSGTIYDYGTNRSYNGATAELPAGTLVYVKQASGAATIGAMYVTVIYLSEV